MIEQKCIKCIYCEVVLGIAGQNRVLEIENQFVMNV